jgi:hypothetical protein
MRNLSISTAWNETVAFVGRHAGPLFTVAFALIVLPGIVFQVIGPGQPAPGEVPALGPWLLFIPVILVLSIVGTLAISALALGRESVVGSAIAHAFRRCLPLIGASLLLALVLLVVMVPLILALGLAPEDFAAPSDEQAGRVFLAMLLVLLIFLVVWVRLIMMTPVAAAEGGGPIAIIRRSWELTSGRFWKLLGFALLLVIAAIVVMLVVTMIFGLLIFAVAGAPQPGSLAVLLMALVSGILNAVFLVVFTTMVARIYVQLAGDPASTAATFD